MLIDTPGLGDTENNDSLHIANIVKYLKQTKRVNAFLIIFNG